MLMAKEWIPFFNTPLAARIWQFTAAILAGALGNIILIGFLSTLLTTGAVSGMLDWIIGFNAALTGYMLVEKSGNSLRYWRWFSCGAGAINTALSVLILVHLYNNLEGAAFIAWADAGILVTIGAVCGALGGWLANKYLDLKRQINR